MKDDRKYDGDERKFNGQRGLIEDPRRRTITHDKMRGRIPDGKGKSDAPESLHWSGYSSVCFRREVDESDRNGGRTDRRIESERRVADGRMVELQGKNTNTKG